MKTVPLRPSRLPDSGGIFTFSNGVRMKEISRSVRQAKQAKFLDADCTCPTVRTVRTVTWQDRTGRTVVTWQILVGRFWASRMSTRVIGWLIIGGHVAQSKGATCHSLVGQGILYTKCWRPRGSTPIPLLHIIP
jgi:hypothetical protein